MKAEFAWPKGDLPCDLEFKHVPRDYVIELINKAIESKISLINSAETRYLSLRPSKNPIGRYKLHTDNKFWFIRVSSRLGQPDLEKSITDYLSKNNVSINPLIVSGVKLNWRGRIYRLDVRPFIKGRHYNGSNQDILELGLTLAACHRVLKDFPDSKKIRLAAGIRYERLANICDLIAEVLEKNNFRILGKYASWAKKHKEWLRIMVEEFEPRLDMHPEAQCLHGEVHPGNVIFTKNNRAVLIDFEESVYSYAPPKWDLAYMVQRFVLRDNPSQQVALGRLDSIKKSYGEDLSGIDSTMRQISWFLISTIFDMWLSYGIESPLRECNKFLKLGSQIQKYSHVL